MSKVLIRHKVIRLDDSFNIIAVYSNSHTHDQVLWSFCDFTVEAEKVRAFQRLEAKVLIVEISIIYDGRVKLVCMFHDTLIGSLGNHRRWSVVARVDVVVEVRDDRRELLLCLLVEVRHCDTCGEYGIVWVRDSHICGGLGSLVVSVSTWQGR